LYDENDFEDKPINISDLYTQNLVKRGINYGNQVVMNKSNEVFLS